MFRLILFSYVFCWQILRDVFDALRETGWLKRILIIAIAIMTGWVLKLFYGTFLIDHALITILATVITYLHYNRRGINRKRGVDVLEYPEIKVFAKYNSFMGRFLMMTVPLSVLSLWIGGALPYLNLVPPESVYFYAFPANWLGVNGQDFMWNGFVWKISLFLFGEERIIPLEFLPTTQYPLFNMYAVLYWLSLPAFMWWAALRGRHLSFLKVPKYYPKLWLEFAKTLAFAIMWLAIDIGMARLLYWIYS